MTATIDSNTISITANNTEEDINRAIQILMTLRNEKQIKAIEDYWSKIRYKQPDGRPSERTPLLERLKNETRKIKYRDLVPAVMDAKTFRELKNRGILRVEQMGRPGVEALIAYDSIPLRFRDEVLKDKAHFCPVHNKPEHPDNEHPSDEPANEGTMCNQQKYQESVHDSQIETKSQAVDTHSFRRSHSRTGQTFQTSLKDRFR